MRNRWYPGRNRDLKVEWDFEDRLVKVVKADGTVVENGYDVDGVMVRTAVNGVGVDYLVDTSGGLSHVVAEIDGSGTVTALYVRTDDMLLEGIRGGVAKMYEADGLGSVRGLLDVSGAKTDTYAYEAFGSTVSSTGTDANPYRFAGERWMADVAMYQNRARWLDTRTGRFVSVDPLRGRDRDPATFASYLYARANPVTHGDPSGKEFTLVGLALTLPGASLLGGVSASPNPPRPEGSGTKVLPPTGRQLLRNPVVDAALDKAWDESYPYDLEWTHEEGGWIYIHPETGMTIAKREWRPANFPKRNKVDLRHPPILMFFYIVADFHTHPFPPGVGEAEPSDGDDDSEKTNKVPGLIQTHYGPYWGKVLRRLNYDGHFGYPEIPGGRM